RLVAEQARLGIGPEMPALDQHVGGHREVEPGVGAQQRAVVAYPEQRALRRAVEVPPDELELSHNRGYSPPYPLGDLARARDFFRAQRFRDLLQHAVDEPMAFG